MKLLYLYYMSPQTGHKVISAYVYTEEKIVSIKITSHKYEIIPFDYNLLLYWHLCCCI